MSDKIDEITARHSPEMPEYRGCNGTLVETSEPHTSRQLAIVRGNERACELDGIWD